MYKEPNSVKMQLDLNEELIDSRIVLPRLSKPVSFPALMALYESNYMRILGLLKLPRKELEGQEFHWTNDEYSIHGKIVEVTKYTALVCLDEFVHDADVEADAESAIRVNHFRVRIYHDARLAAVDSSLQSSDEYRLDALPIDKARIAGLWQQNMFFNKWLEFCVNRNLKTIVD